MGDVPAAGDYSTKCLPFKNIHENSRNWSHFSPT